MFTVIKDDKKFDFVEVEPNTGSDAAVSTALGQVYLDLEHSDLPGAERVLSPKEARKIGVALIQAAYVAESEGGY